MNIDTTNSPNTTEPAIGFIPCYRLPFLSLFHADCMEIMKQYPDKYFDLAIVDPPYGIGIAEWDKNAPKAEYFNELFRVSKNQIIWGGNYFELPPCKNYIIWDKEIPKGLSFADCELAWTSFDCAPKMFRYSAYLDKNDKLHPTQKPVDLYDWINSKYAKENAKILDTHFGSGSIALSVDKANRLDKMNLHLTACEIDLDYVNASIKRINNYLQQTTINF